MKNFKIKSLIHCFVIFNLIFVIALLIPNKAHALTTNTFYVDPDAEAGGDGTTNCIASCGGHAAFQSLAIWVSTRVAANPNLVSSNSIEEAIVDSNGASHTADGATTIDGFTTSAANYIYIHTPTNHRHAGIYDATKYRIEATNNNGMTLNDGNIYITGVQIGITITANNWGYGLQYTNAPASSVIYFNKSIIKALSITGTGGGGGVYLSNANVTAYYFNTIVTGWRSGSDSDFNGIKSFNSTALNLYNSVIYGNYVGLNRGGGTVTALNCVVFNNGEDFYGTITTDYCASDDNDGGGAHDVNISPNANEVADWALAMTSPSTGDFSVKNTRSLLYNAGNGAIPKAYFTDDILGNARSGADLDWDIGAFEFKGTTLKQGPTNSGLVGYWKFDEGAGTHATDSSGNNNTGSIAGGAPWINGELGKALSFDGSSRYVNVGTLGNFGASRNTSSISMWVKRTSNSSQHLMTVSDVSSSQNAIGVKINTAADNTNMAGSVRFALASNDVTPKFLTAATNANSVPLNTWTHIVITAIGSTNNVNIYINGVSKSVTYNNSDSPSNFANFTQYLPIGALNNAGSLSLYFSGYIDDVHIYNRVLTPAEVASLYKEGAVIYKAPTDKGLVGYWKFDEGAGTHATDSSGKGKTGIFSGSPIWTSGKLGKGLKFDGSSSYVQANYDISPTAITVSAWVKAASFPNSYNYILSRPQNCNYNDEIIWKLGVQSDGKVFTHFDNGGPIYYYGTGSHTLNPGTWYFLTATYEPYVGLTGYVNGEADQSVGTGGYGDLLAETSCNPVYIGFGDVPNSVWNGLIDDVRIYNRALTAGEIQTLYQAGAGQFK